VRENQAWVIVLGGEHDLSTAAGLQRWLLPTSTLAVDVVGDLSETAFMDSTGLSVLAHASEEAASHKRGFAVVASPNSAPTRLLALTGADQRLRIYKTRADAFSGLATV
jgi:anti-anti-sigma factor